MRFCLQRAGVPGIRFAGRALILPGLVAWLVAVRLCAASEALPALGAEPSGVTVSGLSAGGYMAVQVHVAHSSRVAGAGVIAGGPYYCAQGSLRTARYNCMTPGLWTPLPEVRLLRAQAESFAKARRIDPARHLSGARVWLFSGTEDRTVALEVVQALQRFYASYGAKSVLVADKPAGHAMVVEQAENACGVTRAPYINDCDYDAAGALLAHLLDGLQPRAAKADGRLVRFDQTPFGDRAISMDETGYVYVPQACEAGGCRVHVAFHGCRQGAAQIGEAFVRGAGYNRWADSNRLIVLYPQAIARRGWPVFNPRGCWDWWGYTGAEYATQEGAQIRAVMQMLARLSGPRR
jgi:poly(3-hydroxybutyrate) depolymerase